MYRQHPDVVTRKLGDDSILVPVQKSIGDLDSVYSLDEVASFLWQLLKEPKTTEELVGAMCSEYAVEESDARADVDEFLGDLSQAGLLLIEE